MITVQHVEEDLSRAFVHAISAKAGIIVCIGDRSHDYTIDGSFKHVTLFGGRRCESGFSLDFQLKACVNVVLEDNVVKYDLDSKAYNYLVERTGNPGTTPVILVLLALPSDQAEWLNITENELVMKRCCYWTKFFGEKTDNKNTVRIEIPRSQMLTPESLRDLLQEIEEGVFVP